MTLAVARPGEVLFARYAYPPNALGYCGTGDGREWLQIADGAVPITEPITEPIAERARSFDGAWPYLEFLAAVGGGPDPLGEAVTRAYWVGTDLLDRVDPAAFAAFARRAFGDQRGADWSCLAPADPNPLPHHSFHVFVVYPWVGVLRRTGSPRALEVLDRCRIRWGRVESVDGDLARVRTRPLTWDGSVIGIGEPVAETVRWADRGRSLLPRVDVGDVVSLHWEWVCDVLTPQERAVLTELTHRQLEITNRSRGR